MDSAKRVLNGTYGELWFDGEYVAEATGCKAVSKFDKETILRCGTRTKGTKTTSVTNTGSLKFYKVRSRMIRKIADAVKSGVDPEFTLISAIKDPDGYGDERVVLYSVSFDQLTLIDWELGKIGTRDEPFTFGEYEAPDLIPE